MPFPKGNKLGGRRKSLTKPDLLLPMVFNAEKINWAKDFGQLYRAVKLRSLAVDEQRHLDLLMALLPYLCTKIQLKDIDGAKMTAVADSIANAKQTSELLKALEGEDRGSSSTQ